jgi:outer membrane protein assembly factor BamB
MISFVVAISFGLSAVGIGAASPMSNDNTLDNLSAREMPMDWDKQEEMAPSPFVRGFNTPGNVLISDQFNNRVIEVNPCSGDIVWSFGSNDPNLCNPGPGTVIGTNWAERVSGGLTLIAGTGIPPGVDPALPDGCADNRVILVDKGGNIIWQYGQAGVTGSGPNQLNVPVAVIQLPNGHFLITDQGNNRIIEVNFKKQIVWSYGPTSGPGVLNSPNSAELLRNGHILIADENNNRVIEITRNGTIVWQYDIGIQAAAFASRLPNGNTLITDAGNARIFIVTPAKKIVFEYFTNTSPGSNSAPLPTNAVKLKSGEIIIADQFNHRVFAINPQKEIVWQYGMTNIPGNGPGQLNGPYTAFVIGDYTGQTPPP